MTLGWGLNRSRSLEDKAAAQIWGLPPEAYTMLWDIFKPYAGKLHTYRVWNSIWSRLNQHVQPGFQMLVSETLLYLLKDCLTMWYPHIRAAARSKQSSGEGSDVDDNENPASSRPRRHHGWNHNMWHKGEGKIRNDIPIILNHFKTIPAIPSSWETFCLRRGRCKTNHQDTSMVPRAKRKISFHILS